MTEISNKSFDDVIDITKIIHTDKVRLGCRVWGNGTTHVVFIHGNMASKDWLELAAPHFPKSFKVWAIDWRGSGDSDAPKPNADYSNYSIQTHAKDMLAALDVLGIERCHLATHSTGGIISTHMLLEQPKRFGRVLALDPVSPRGVNPTSQPNWRENFARMGESREVSRRVMASTAPTLFDPLFDSEELIAGVSPRFAASVPPKQREFFESIVVDRALAAPDGIRFGSMTNLIQTHERYFKENFPSSRDYINNMKNIKNEHLLLWGEYDSIINLADLKWMTKIMQNCHLLTIPNVGHSMNIERPELYAGYLGGFLCNDALST